MSSLEKMSKIALTALVLGLFAFLTPLVRAPVDQPQDGRLEGGMTFTVYPDESIGVRIVGGFEWGQEPWETPPPFYDAAFEMTNSPAGANLTDCEGSLVVKIGPELAEMLSDLDLDVSVHGEETSSEASILFNLPGFIGVDGRIESTTDEGTSETTLDLEMTVEVWYTLYPKETIEQFVEAFPLLKAQLVSQVGEFTEGNLTIRDLTLVESEMGPFSATLTLTASMVGDLEKGIMALFDDFSLPLEDIPQIEQGIDLEELKLTKIRSFDVHATFDNEELALTVAFEGALEGDLDRQVNAIKNLFLEEALRESDMDPDTARMVEDFLLPTEASVVDLSTTLDYSFEDGSHALDFAIEGLVLRPPTTVSLLEVLQEASAEVSQPGFNLTLEGGSEDGEYVEITVPPATTEPILKEPGRVVWAFDDIENLDQVTFEVKEEANPLLNPQLMIPVAGVAVAVAAAAGFILAKRMR